MSFTGFESSGHNGHSADVRISLVFNGHSIPVAQLGPGFLLLQDPFDHPPGRASIILRVDQKEDRWDVQLTDGISVGSRKVAIVAAE